MEHTNGVGGWDAGLDRPQRRGVQHRARWAAIGAATAVVLGAGGLMTATAVNNSGERAVFVPIAPCRVMDTRVAPDTIGPRGTALGAGETYAIAVVGTNGNCTIPADAVGLSMNVTAANPNSVSYLTVFPSDAVRPLASNLNFVAGEAPVPNAVTVDISADGKVSFYNNGGTVDVIADIVGYYQDHNHDDRYYTKAEADATEGKQKYLPIDLFGEYTDGTVYQIGGSLGVSFKDASGGIQLVNFVVPPDLTPNTKMTLQFTYTIAQTSCTVSLGANGIWVTRQGQTPATVPLPPAATPGVVPVGGDPRPAPAPKGAAGTMTFLLGQPGDGSGFTPGDAVSVALRRFGATDTCTERLILTGAQIVYS